MKTAVDLHHAETQRCGHTEYRCYHSDGIHYFPDDTLGAFLTDERFETGAQQRRAAFTEGVISQGQTEDAVDGPGVDPPMGEGVAHGHRRRLRGAAFTVGRREVMAQRFRRAPEHQSDAHPGGKEHKEPAECGILRFFIVFSQTDLSVLTQRQNDQKDDEKRNSQQVKPAEIRRKDRQNSGKQRFHLAR